ncbi:MAG: glycosyltransferase family 2 protein [Bacteroidota bacterium]
MAMPLVSILMPVFNAAPYLEECLQSIQAQTFVNWELLAVDDGSTDQSWSILAKAAAKDHRIRCFANGKQGIIAALRKAYTESKGQQITRMDADDRMAPQKLERMTQLLEQSAVDTVVTGMVEYFAEGTLGAGYRRYAKWLNELGRAGNSFREIYKECVIPSPCWLVARTTLERCGAFRPNVYPEDYDLCFRFYANGLKHRMVPEVLHFWRDHGSRASRNDPNYADTSFIDLKVPWFLKLDYGASRPLVLWGAGKKGKRIAQLLLKAAIPFRWVCNTERRWGTEVYGMPLESTVIVEELAQPKVIIAVAKPEEQAVISKQLAAVELSLGKDFYFFC